MTETTSKVAEFREMRDALKARLEEIESEKIAIMGVLGKEEPRKPGRPKGRKNKPVEVTP